MSILEHYKKEVDEVLRQSILNLNTPANQKDQLSETTLDASSGKHQLIRQVAQTINIQPQHEEVDYEAQQFLYFASQNKDKKRKCVVCKTLNPKYRCPKCKVEYCSQQHYKTHNLFCTERFFQQQVQNQMKATKASKQNIKKMVQLLKQNQQQLAKDQRELMGEVKLQQISQQRLLQIQKMINNNQQVNLRPQQINQFQHYLQQIELTTHQNQETKLQPNQQPIQQSIFQQYRPYWLIEEGLSFYLIRGHIQVQQLNQSKNKQLLLYRQKSSQILQEKLQIVRKNISLKKVSSFASFDLLQVVYISSLLMRSFNGQYLQNPLFIEIFEQVYDENLSKMLCQTYSGSLKEICKLQINAFSSIKSQLINLKNQYNTEFKLFQTWLQVVPFDCQKILTNKFLILQTLLRIVQSTQGASQSKNQNSATFDSCKQQKKMKTSRLKLQKKMEFLLCYCNDVVFIDQKKRTDQVNVREMMLNQIKKQMADATKYLQQVQRLRNRSQREKVFKINSILIPTNNK